MENKYDPNELTEKFIAEINNIIFKSIRESFNKYDSGLGELANNYLNSYEKALHEIKNILEPMSNINPEQKREVIDAVHFMYLVMPTIAWEEIVDIFKGLTITEEEIKRIVFLLKPFPVEEILSDNTYTRNIEKNINGIIRNFTTKIQHESPLLGAIKKHAQEKGYDAYQAGIEQTENGIDVLRSIVESLKAMQEKRFKRWNIGKNIDKSPTAHVFWRTRIPMALKEVNKHCHDNCKQKNCRKTHMKAINIIAKLLKVLYPDIWKNNITNIVNNIKSIEQRELEHT